PRKRHTLTIRAKRLAEHPQPPEPKHPHMKNLALNSQTNGYVTAYYKQYHDFVILYNEKFAKPAGQIMKVLYDQKLLTPKPKEFDEEIEWIYYLLWHHEGRRARHGASMMAPDYAHWHGMFEVADRFYQHLVPQARELAHKAEADGKKDQAKAVTEVIDAILKRPEHAWLEKK